MFNKFIVCGLPRTGTSLMMRLVHLSGYEVIYDEEFGKKLGRFRSNDWFYEDPRYINGKGLEEINGVVKVMVWGLVNVPRDRKVIWIERDKKGVIDSWKGYARQKITKSKYTEEEDYKRYMEMSEILPEFDYVKISFDNLYKDPFEENQKLKKIGVNIKPEALKEIKCG